MSHTHIWWVRDVIYIFTCDMSRQYMCVYVCVCVCERERWLVYICDMTATGQSHGTLGWKMTHVCVCVCVCVREGDDLFIFVTGLEQVSQVAQLDEIWHTHMCVCVCVCVCEREREREYWLFNVCDVTETGESRGTVGWDMTHTHTCVCVCVCVCVWVCEGERNDLFIIVTWLKRVSHVAQLD